MKQMDSNDFIKVNNKEYKIVKLLGHGKGGYSYLATNNNELFTLKQIHHEPCDYYKFGDKMASELRDYNRLLAAGVRMPKLIDYNNEQEIIIKEYIEGKTIAQLVEEKNMLPAYLEQIRIIADDLKKQNINIDYYPTNFIVQNELLYYVDYECNDYMEKWDFDNWGIQYWK